MPSKDRVKIGLFADDTLLTIENPLMVMDRVKLHLREFGLQIHWSKSERILFNYGNEGEELIKRKFDIHIQKVIKNLGINIPEFRTLERKIFFKK